MTTTSDEPGFGDLAPTIAVRGAAGLHVVSGLYLLLSAVQLLTTVVFFGELWLVQVLNWALIPMGIGQIIVGAQLIRMRTPWAVVATVVGFLIALLVTGWMIANVAFTIFSCMQLGALIFAWSAAMLSPLTIGAVARASKARKKLEEGGMGLGL